MGLISYLKPGKDVKKPAALPLGNMGTVTMSPASTVGTSMTGSSTMSSQVRWNIMADYLRLQQVSRQWTDGPDQGVVLKRSRGNYICSPPELMYCENGFMRAIEALNVQVCVRKSCSFSQ